MEQYFPVGCIKKAKQMADSLSLLPDLELYLFDDSEVKTDVTKTGNGEWGMGNGEWGMG